MAMYAPYGPFFAVITELLPSNVTAGAVALINSLGALGSFAGSYLVGYLKGFEFIHITHPTPATKRRDGYSENIQKPRQKSDKL